MLLLLLQQSFFDNIDFKLFNAEFKISDSSPFSTTSKASVMPQHPLSHSKEVVKNALL